MKRKGSAFVAVLGAAVAVLGLWLMRGMDGPLPGVLIGLGSGALGLGLSGVFTPLVARKHPEIARQKADMARQKAIEQRDERNIAVNNQAKARAYDMMIYVFSALIIACTWINAGLTVMLMLMGAYLLLLACYIGFFAHYHKTM